MGTGECVSDDVACEQALLFGQAMRASRERAREGLRRSLARSRETRFTRPNSRACSQASDDVETLTPRTWVINAL